MTTIKIKKQNGKIVAFSANGHTEFQNSGTDIICSAISTLLQSTVLGIKQVVKAQCKTKKASGVLNFVLTEMDVQKIDLAQTLLQTMEISIAEIAKGRSKNIKLEVENENN
ncbi:MAG: ribosomal-processing cysteine protease Prp [Clostridia bacterium]